MQKVITIQMKAGDEGKAIEHLSECLEDGWRVISTAAAGAGQETYRSFLIVIVLEKS